MTAYDRTYLERAKTSFGRMLDYAVYDLKYDLLTFWKMFLFSPISKQWERGNISLLAGRSGVELALMVCGIEKDYPKPFFSEQRSREYWLGWALAHYQWKTCLSFSQITENISIEEIRGMYYPYHEMDIRQFCDKLDEMRDHRKQQADIISRRQQPSV